MKAPLTRTWHLGTLHIQTFRYLPKDAKKRWFCTFAKYFCSFYKLTKSNSNNLAILAGQGVDADTRSGGGPWKLYWSNSERKDCISWCGRHLNYRHHDLERPLIFQRFRRLSILYKGGKTLYLANTYTNYQVFWSCSKDDIENWISEEIRSNLKLHMSFKFWIWKCSEEVPVQSGSTPMTCKSEFGNVQRRLSPVWNTIPKWMQRAHSLHNLKFCMWSLMNDYNPENASMLHLGQLKLRHWRKPNLVHSCRFGSIQRSPSASKFFREV